MDRLTCDESLHPPSLAALPEEVSDVEGEGLAEEHHPDPLVPGVLHPLPFLHSPDIINSLLLIRFEIL